MNIEGEEDPKNKKNDYKWNSWRRNSI